MTISLEAAAPRNCLGEYTVDQKDRCLTGQGPRRRLGVFQGENLKIKRVSKCNIFSPTLSTINCLISNVACICGPLCHRFSAAFLLLLQSMAVSELTICVRRQESNPRLG